MEYKIMLCTLMGILLGFVIICIALYIFRKTLIKKYKNCCAKCIYCSESGGGFICDKSGEVIKSLLISGMTCESYKDTQ